MAEEKTKQESAVQEPHHAPGHDHEVEQLKELLGRFGTPILAGVVIALLLIIGFGTYRSSKTGSANRASLALAGAESIEDFQQILSDFADTPSAPIAQLGVAAQHFEAGDYDAANSAYAAFIAENPGHPMIAGATLAQIQCLEAQGETEAALDGFTGFIAANPENYLVPAAALGKARCLSLLQRLEDARAAYEEIIAAHPDSLWSNRAETELRQVDRLQRAQSATP